MKLLVLDVEGTLFETKLRIPGTALDSTIWQSLAHILGPTAEREEAETHQKWERCEYRNYIEWMEDTIAVHRRHGLRREQFWAVIKAAQYNPGVEATLANISQSRFKIVLISGGFRELAARVQKDFDVRHAFAACEYFFDDNGRLSSWNLLPCDFGGKLAFVKLMLEEYGLSDQEWVFVGDGRNDVQIAERAPTAVGYRAHKELAQVCARAITDFSQLPGILDGLG
jgi:phosphoserine phosphatase